jgi:hypothetical protein
MTQLVICRYNTLTLIPAMPFSQVFYLSKAAVLQLVSLFDIIGQVHSSATASYALSSVENAESGLISY